MSLAPVEERQVETDLISRELPVVNWNLVVWDDPINLMSYVERVFMTYFGYSRQKSHKLMLEVHNNGKSIVSSGMRELMETHASAMHDYGLWATVERGDA